MIDLDFSTELKTFLQPFKALSTTLVISTNPKAKWKTPSTPSKHSSKVPSSNKSALCKDKFPSAFGNSFKNPTLDSFVGSLTDPLTL